MNAHQFGAARHAPAHLTPLDDQLYAAYADGRADERDEIRKVLLNLHIAEPEGVYRRLLAALDERK